MAERLFVTFTAEQAAALTMYSRRSPEQRTLALQLLAKIRQALDAVDPHVPPAGMPTTRGPDRVH